MASELPFWKCKPFFGPVFLCLLQYFPHALEMYIFSPVLPKSGYLLMCILTKCQLQIDPSDVTSSVAAAWGVSWSGQNARNRETENWSRWARKRIREKCREKCHAIWNDNYIVIFIVNTFRFYIGCDLCTNWYHGECVGITEKEAKKMDVYICNDCKRAQEGSSEELYCICRTPYDESQWVLIRTSYLMSR